eukprot:2774974-Amphidinium_carterae.1
MWRLIDSNVFGQGSRAANGIASGMDLRAFYKRFQLAHPTSLVTRLNEFSLEHTLGGTPEKN